MAEKNYFAALAVALMLPSMCSRIEYAGNAAYCNPSGRWHDRGCYVDWCKNYISPSGFTELGLGTGYPFFLYSLRCDMLHAGTTLNTHVVSDGVSESVALMINSGGVCHLEDVRAISIEQLCCDIFRSAENWFENHKYDLNTPCQEVLDMSDKKDRDVLDERLGRVDE